jgi:uncharacterized membrane protein
MQIDAELLSPGWLWACRVAATIAVALAARRLDWKALLQDAPTLHRFAACTVGLLVLWSIRATVAQGPGLHILGVTTVTLVLGPASAMIATLIAEAVTGLTMKTESALAASWLAGSVLPVVATDGIRRLVRRMLPHDPFSFIFGCGFFGAAAATVAAHIGAYLMVGAPDQIWSGAVPSSLGFLLLVAFPEAFINGAIITMLVVYCPQWLAGYDPVYDRGRRR